LSVCERASQVVLRREKVKGREKMNPKRLKMSKKEKKAKLEKVLTSPNIHPHQNNVRFSRKTLILKTL
jgi:hypothetical protein